VEKEVEAGKKLPRKYYGWQKVSAIEGCLDMIK
jgi:hypothetical protein